MKRYAITLLTAAALLAVLPVHAASFNCKKAGNATERAICANQRLNEADTKLANTYSILLGFGGENSRIRSEQLQWLKNRNQCGSRVACIAEEYQFRQGELNRELSRYQNNW